MEAGPASTSRARHARLDDRNWAGECAVAGDGDYDECRAAALGDLLAAKELLSRADLLGTAAAWHAAAARTPHGQPIVLDAEGSRARGVT